MALPKELQDMKVETRQISLGCTRLIIGLTDIHIDHKKHMVTVEHRGNMGDNIKDVEENVDLCFSKGAFKRLEKLCKNMNESGGPDYYYKRIMKF